MKLLTLFKISGLLLSAALLSPVNAGTLNAGRDLAANCLTCHNATSSAGASGALKTLDGYPSEGMLAVLAGFRTGERPATVMHQIVKGYTVEQLTLIAHYFENQPAKVGAK